jgi:hypothetical protein
MDLDEINKDLERIGLPNQPRERKPDLNVKQGKLKRLAIRALAFLLFVIIGLFGLFVVDHYKSPIMTLIVLVYFGLGIFLAYKLFSLTYTGWLYTLLLSAAGILMPLLALVSRGLSNPALTTGAIVVIVLSLIAAALLWWAKDLFGIKSYKEVFLPYR